MKHTGLVALVLIPMLLHAAPTKPPVTNELSRLSGIYESEKVKIKAKYAEQLADLPSQYEKALDGLEKTFQQRGALQSVVFVRTERTAFRKSGVVAAEAAPGEPSELAAQRVKQLEAPASLATARSAELDRLAAAYASRLKSLQQDWTRRGLIDEALAVQARIDSLPALTEAPPTSSAVPVHPIPAAVAKQTARQATTIDAPAPTSIKATAGASKVAGVLSGTQSDAEITLESGKTFAVEGEYFVPKGLTLRIEAGAILQFAKDASLSVSGTMMCNGNLRAPVRMQGKVSGVGTWKGIRLEGVGTECVIEGVILSGATQGITIAGGRPKFKSCAISRCVKGVVLGNRANATFEDCLVTDCTSHGFFDHISGAVLSNCTLSNNDGWGYFCDYYGNPTILNSKIVGNKAGGIRGSGYDHTSTAHGSVICGNGDVDVQVIGSKDWDYSGNWWGRASTQKLASNGDTANLNCIEDGLDTDSSGRVRLHDYLTVEPVNCGSSLSSTR